MSLDVMLVLFQVVVLLFAFSVHECVHAWAAMRFGDPTAYMVGRVTLNPARSIDPWGSIAMPLLGLVLSGFAGPLIGWGAPVPITLRNFKKIKRDDILTTSAGLFSHLLLAGIALVLLLIMKHTPGVGANAVISAMLLAKRIPDVDTTALPKLFPIALLLYYCVVTNIVLFVFNLIPVPPLDGSRLLRNVLSYKAERIFDNIGMLGSFIIFAVGWRIVYPIFYPPLMRTFDILLLQL